MAQIVDVVDIKNRSNNTDANTLYQNYRDARKYEDHINQVIDKIDDSISSYNLALYDVPDRDKLISQLKIVRTNFRLALLKYHDQSDIAFAKYRDAVNNPKYQSELHAAVDHLTHMYDSNSASHEVKKPTLADPLNNK